MDNYVIWKDVNSNTIPGLIIQELPSISKPPMRYNAIDVDGRNGDIIDELGYGAYDKTLLIGLANNFDIDQVISYFSDSCNAVLYNACFGTAYGCRNDGFGQYRRDFLYRGQRQQRR